MSDHELNLHDSAAIEKLGDARQKIVDQLGQVIVGQTAGDRGTADFAVQPRALPAGRRAGAGQDADDQHAQPDAEPHLQPHPVHARPHAGRHHRHRRDRGEPQHRRARVPLSRRAAVQQRDPGRRNQPHAAEDPGGAAGGHAGAAGHAWAACGTSWPIRSSCWPRRTPSSRKAPIRCPRPSKTASCSRCSSATRASTRSSRWRGARPPRWPTRSSRCSRPQEILELQRIVRQVPVSDHVIRYALALVRQTRVREPGVPDFVDEQLSWGAGPRAVQFLILGAQGPGAAAGPHPRHLRGRAGAGQARAAAPPGAEFHRRERRRHARRPDRADSGRSPPPAKTN